MPNIKSGDKIKFHYVGTLEDGSVFDNSEETGEPLEFTVGSGQIIPGFDKGVIGMEVGESKQIAIPSDDAYGDHNPELLKQIEKAQIPEDIGEPEEGMVLQLGLGEGQTTVAVIKEVDEKMLTLDLNHPLAGKDLTFDIKIVQIN